MATAGSIVIDLLMKTGSFVTDSQRAEKQMKQLQKTASTAAGGIKSAFAGIAGGIVAGLSIGAAVDAFVTGVNTAISSADRLDELSTRFGTSTEQLSAWGYAAKMTGSDIEGLAGVIPKFSKSIADAADEGSEAAKILKALGIEVKDQAGNLRSYEELLPEVADRFKDLDNVTTETAVAMQLFGRSGSEFLEFLNLGSDGLLEMESRARALGALIGEDTTAAAAAFNDKVDDLRTATNAWFTQIAASLLPSMTELVGEMTEFVKEGGNARAIADSISEGFRGMAAAADAGHTVISWLDNIRGALAGVELQGNAAFQSLNPANWNSTDLARLGAQYGRGTAMIEGGWAAGQTQSPAGLPMPANRGGPGGRRSRATQEEIAEAKDFADRAKRRAEYEAKLDAFFAGSGKTGGKAGGGKSDAEKQAEALERAYESAADQLDRQLTLRGETTKAAALQYEIEKGALQGISDEKAAILLSDARTADILDDITAMEQVWAESAAEVTREAERRQAAFDRVNQDILDQIELLGMTRDQQEAWNALAWADVDAESERGKELLANVERLQQVRAATFDVTDAMDALRDAGSDFFVDWTSGAKSFEEAGLDALDSLHQRILDMIAENLMDRLFGKQGDPGGGAWGDAIGSIFGAFFGGAREGGGDTLPGRGYLVGEDGPEWFQPRTAGTIVPADATSRALAGRGDGFSLTQNFYNPQMNDPRTESQRQQQAAGKMRMAVARNGG